MLWVTAERAYTLQLYHLKRQEWSRGTWSALLPIEKGGLCSREPPEPRLGCGGAAFTFTLLLPVRVGESSEACLRGSRRLCHLARRNPAAFGVTQAEQLFQSSLQRVDGIPSRSGAQRLEGLSSCALLRPPPLLARLLGLLLLLLGLGLLLLLLLRLGLLGQRRWDVGRLPVPAVGRGGQGAAEGVAHLRK